MNSIKRPAKKQVELGIVAYRGISVQLISLCYNIAGAAGWSSLVARRAHNPKVAGSNPAPATKFCIQIFTELPVLRLASIKIFVNIATYVKLSKVKNRDTVFQQYIGSFQLHTADLVKAVVVNYSLGYVNGNTVV